MSTDLGGPEHRPESKWAIGYKGQIAFALLPDKNEVYSYKWTVKRAGKYNVGFYFDYVHGFSTGNTSLDNFQVENSVSTWSTMPYIYSYLHIKEKATPNLTFDLEFSLNDFNKTKYCTVNDFIFSGEVYI